MMRKIATILFLLLTALLIAHAILPHHHHDGAICLAASHCQNASQPHEHNSDENDHQHDGQKGVQFCILKQVILSQNNHTQKIYKSVNSKTFFPIIIFAILSSGIEINSVNLSCFLYFLIIQSNYSVFISKCFGLRAPPIVQIFITI